MIEGLLRRLGFGRGAKSAPAARGARDSRGGPKAKAKASPSRGNADADRELFLEAMREASPDFERFCRAAQDDEAVETALRTLYAALPPTGRGGRTAVVRRFLLKKAAEDGDEEDEAELERLSEKQVALVARRAGIPI